MGRGLRGCVMVQLLTVDGLQGGSITNYDLQTITTPYKNPDRPKNLKKSLFQNIVALTTVTTPKRSPSSSDEPAADKCAAFLKFQDVRRRFGALCLVA